MFQVRAESIPNCPPAALPPEESGDHLLCLHTSLCWTLSLAGATPLGAHTLAQLLLEATLGPLRRELAWILQTLDTTRAPGLCKVMKPC